MGGGFVKYLEMLIKYLSGDIELVVGYISFGERYKVEVKYIYIYICF